MAGAAMSALALPFIRSAQAQSSRRVVVANWGGAIAEAKSEVFYGPFQKETGIEVMQTTGLDLAKIRLQVQSRDVEWDLVDGVLGNWVPTTEHYDLFEQIDRGVVPWQTLDPGARRDSLVGNYYFRSGLTVPTGRFPPDRRPGNWMQFWDTVGFPGRRGLFARVGETLEIALMGDGVHPSDVYPCDVERAFKALERIKPSVSNWYTTSAQSIDLLQRGECDFHGYGVFVLNAIANGAKIFLNNEYNLIGVNWMGVTKGSPNKDAAMLLAAFILRPDRQAEFMRRARNSSVVTSVFANAEPDLKASLADATHPNNCLINLDWWAGKEEDLDRRFKAFLLS